MLEMVMELAANRDIVPEWRREVTWWKEGSTLPMEPLMWGMRLLGGAMLTYVGYVAWRNVRGKLGGVMDFRKVARGFGLGWMDCWVLWRGARACGLESPLTLMVCESTLRAYAAELVEDGEKRGRAEAKKARRLSRGVLGVGKRLFG